MRWIRITKRLPANGPARDAGKLRMCRTCGRLVDHAEDHKAGCPSHVTDPAPTGTSLPGETNLDWCEALAASMQRGGDGARVRGSGAVVWVERRV